MTNQSWMAGAAVLLAGIAQANVTTTFTVDTAGVGTAANSDFYIASTAANTLVDNTQLLAGSPERSAGVDYRSYIKFDLSGLSDGGEVTAATFRICRKVGANDTYGEGILFQRTAAFVAGGDSDYAELTGTELGVITSGDITTAAYIDVDVTAVVEAWRTGTASNYGFAIQGAEGVSDSGKYFDSATGANVPELVVSQMPEPEMIEYYVATSGSDSNPGTLAEPFATIQHAADIMDAGDTCIIREGVYRETVTPARSGTADQPIIYMAYPNEEVVINGADVVSGWSQHSNSVYQAVMDWDLGDGFNQLFVNGAMVNRARWPNTGTDLLSPTTATATAASESVTFSVSRPTDYWVGGTVYGLFGSKWTSQGATITASTAAGALTVSDKTVPWYTGSGAAYITGILGELDSAGEWFLDGTNLYLWAPGSVDPSTVTVEAKARKWCINLSGKSYVKFRDIDLFAGSINLDSDHCEITGCDAQYLSHFTKYTWDGMDAGGDRENGNNGVWINGDYNVISNCTFTHSAGSGILIYGGSNVVTRSVISETDYSATYSCPMAIKGSTGGNRILFNTMFNTARDVLQLYGATADEIMYNNLYNAGMMCHDLGITYQWGRDGQGTVIAYNWIHDNKAPRSNPGIYNDNYCRNFIEHHNVIWNCEAGVRLNRPHDQLFVYNNTLFNCRDVNTSTYNQWPDYTPGWWIYGDASNHDLRNNLYLGSNPDSQLEDYANKDFRLKTGAAAIDAGVDVSPYTDGYLGAAPDLGAYEAGRSQWTAGHDGVALQPLNEPAVHTGPATVPEGTAGNFAIPKVEKNITAININGKLAWDTKSHPIPGIGAAKEDAEFVYFNNVQPGAYQAVVSYVGTTPSYDAGPYVYRAPFIKLDKKTQGNWGGVYGKDGYALFNYHGNGKHQVTMPEFCKSINYHRDHHTNLTLATQDPRAPAADSSNAAARKIGCIHTGNPRACRQRFCVDIAVADNSTYDLALYFVDWNKSGMRLSAEILDLETKELIGPTKYVEDSKDGAYLVYRVTGSCRVSVNHIRGDNATLSALFFDKVTPLKTSSFPVKNNKMKATDRALCRSVAASVVPNPK